MRVKNMLPVRVRTRCMGVTDFLCYTGAMSETQQPPEGIPFFDAHVEKIHAFMKAHRAALEPLIGGKLLDGTNGPNEPHVRGWKNVVEHCIDVGRALDVLARLLELPENDRDAIVNIGLVHDWNKRLTKDAGTFDTDERSFAEEYARRFLAEHDPDGHLLNATEPDGLERLEGSDASIGEHLVHLVDLSSMEHGIATPEERIADLRERHKHIAEETDEFWKRKLALALQEERMILERLRTNKIDVNERDRLRDVLKRYL